MKQLLIINPVAGQGIQIEPLKKKIKNLENFDFYITKRIQDAEQKAKQFCENLNGEEGRIFVAGGDGTLNEVVNGVIGFINVAVGVIPHGTGNDFIRNFAPQQSFLNFDSQLQGQDRLIDLIQYEGIIEEKLQKRYCCNMFNIGFDCDVVELAGRLKKKPFIAGPFAYYLSILINFIKKKGCDLEVFVDDHILSIGNNLLCCIGNGKFCGGGVCASPKSDVDDGIFEVNVVHNISRFKCFSLFAQYAKGTYLDSKQGQAYTNHKSCKTARIQPHTNKTFHLCADGEIKETQGVTMTIIPNALRFIVPKH